MLVDRDRRPEKVKGPVVFVKKGFPAVEVDRLFDLLHERGRIVLAVDRVVSARNKQKQRASLLSSRPDVKVLEVIQDGIPFGHLVPLRGFHLPTNAIFGLRATLRPAGLPHRRRKGFWVCI